MYLPGIKFCGKSVGNNNIGSITPEEPMGNTEVREQLIKAKENIHQKIMSLVILNVF